MNFVKIWEDEPKKLEKKVVFEVPLKVVLLGSFVCGSGLFALSIFFMRECFL